MTVATLTVSFNETATAPYTYTAKYYNEASEAGNPLVLANQSPKTDSFDPAADIMVSKVISSDDTRLTSLQFTMGRVVSVNKMILTGLESGEKVATVVFELADGYMVARYMVDKNSFSNSGKKLSFNYNNVPVAENGSFPVYFISAPVDNASIKDVIVTTDKHVYTKSSTLDPNPFEGKTISFAAGTMKRFTMAMGEYGEAISSGTAYTLVESIDALYDGATYLIYGDGFVLGEQKTNNRAAVAVSENNGTITIDNTIDAYPVVIESVSGGYAIKDIKNNGYLYNNATDKNYLKNKAEKGEYTTWTISISNGTASINNVDNTARGIMGYNPNNGSPLFAAYGTVPNGGTSNLALYVDVTTCVELADPNLSFEGEATINVNWADIAAFTAPTLNNPHNVEVTYSSSNTDVATVDSATGEIEFVGDGTTVITATSTKTAEYKAGSAQYTLVVTGAPVEYDFTTVAELNALAAETTKPTEFNGTLTDAVISFAPDSKNAVIKDGTGSVLVFKSNHGYAQGQTFTGEMTITLTKYNNASEITAIDAEFTGTGAAVDPEGVTLADLVGNFATWQNAYVTVEDLEVVSVSDKNINVKNGDKTYVVYSSAANATCVTGDIIKVTGTIAQYSSKDQVKAWTADDIVITQEHQKAKHTITFAQPEEGGTFTVSANGAQISSGTELDEDAVVTLAATAADGFTFGGWTVNGATVSGNTETATFTVGTSDVTIAAAFVSNNLTSEEVSGTLTMTDGSLALTTSSGITVVQAKGTGTTSVNNTYNTIATLRVYKGHTLSFSGKTIKRIEITVDGNYYGNTLGVNTGVLTTTTTSGGTIVWEGSSDSVTITNAATANNIQLRTKKIVVYY